MEPGIYDNLPAEEYHSGPGVSVSTLKRFSEAPAKCLVHRPETPALARGTLVHCAVLEPEMLESRFVATDVERRGTKAWDAAEAAAAGRTLVKRVDWDEALAMRDAVQAHPVARELLSPGLLTEQSIYWRDERTGLLCRGRADVLRLDMRIIVDPKTTRDASSRGFGRAAGDLKYHLQAQWYLDGVEQAGGWRPETFIFIAIESEPPHLVACYEVEPAHLDVAKRQLVELLDRYAACKARNIWPGYSDTLERLQLPGWALAEA